ncbi:formin-1-like isoform X2 [Aricia agestis]|uniref:formin-1-like isoform X2 n=1 Tax=Aricia agestis TaxID=91739 RepID=UPI001C20AC83|nr:formin-1-like isoform X2 [Aricia agestis]
MHFERDYYDDEEFENDDMINNFSGPPSRFNHPRSMNFNRNNAYNNAYGDYRGGYGPPGGFGSNWRAPPPPRFGPPGSFGPPPRGSPGPPMRFGRPPKDLGPPPLLPPPPRGIPEFPWGRGFGPRGPPMKRQPLEDKTIKYLIKCGVTKENLKNLPKNLLALYEPEYCGLCAHNLESHAVSRMHYLSKNHQKNQKKWLAQQSDDGSRKNKEIPIKSRELYCELCDVHITSKAHSDSHYSGKQHRAIVEGRKKPRNPILLQHGMENRVDQLIRREKKFIKTSKDEESGDAAAGGDAKPNVASDLYCDICKTSVTCTEQMTMHLNGKRHLAKEKQHILRMMKGEKSDEANESAANEEEMDVKDEQEGQDDAAAAEPEGDNHDDWANGNGTWEETPNTE